MTFITVLAQEQPLRAKLDPLGLPGAAGNRRLLPFLVLDRPNTISIALDEIDDRCEVQRFAREMDGALMQRCPRTFRLRNAAVNALPFHRITALFPFALDPF